MFKILVPALVFSIIPQFTSAEDSPAANDGYAVEEPPLEDLEPGESTAPYKAGGVKVSASLRKKIQELEMIAAEEKGQDDAALERIYGENGGKLALLRFNNELVEVLADKEVDWRVRYLLLRVKKFMVTSRSVEKRLPALKTMLADRAQHPRVRGGVALLISSGLAKEHVDIREVMTEIAVDTAAPAALLEPVMAVLGGAGIDDVDRLLEIMNRAPGSFNEVGINLNAIRSLCRSQNPKAPELLMKILEESAPDSFFNVTAIEGLQCMIVSSPERRAALVPVLTPKLLKMVDDRSYMGASRNYAAELLVRLNVREVYEPITRWFLPVGEDRMPVKDSGGGAADVFWGTRLLADLCDKRGIKAMEDVLKKYPADTRFTWEKENLIERGLKFPEGSVHYKRIQEHLKRLKKCVRENRKATWHKGQGYRY